MARHIYYTFNLSSGLAGLTRALSDADIEIEHIDSESKHADITFLLHGISYVISLEETDVNDHPLARLGRVTAVVVTTPVGVMEEELKEVLVRAFLRGGG